MKNIFSLFGKGKKRPAGGRSEFPMTPLSVNQLMELKALQDHGVEQYQFLCGLDDRTCPVCRALDGQVFQTKDARPGYNFPPMHEGCRCMVVDYDPFEKLDAMVSGVVPPTEE